MTRTKTRTYMCRYGNCDSEDITVIVSVPRGGIMQRVRFCSEAHAALWLMLQCSGFSGREFNAETANQWIIRQMKEDYRRERGTVK